MSTFDTTSLPDHARVIANPDVWMEGDGVAQFAKTARLPGCVRAVAMPDLHVGKGPVGAVFATSARVYPHLLGGDVGCGVRVFATGTGARSSLKSPGSRMAKFSHKPLPLVAAQLEG